MAQHHEDKTETVKRMAAKDSRSNEEFAEYLDRVGSDYAESGYEATSEDYHEAARRIRDLDAKATS